MTVSSAAVPVESAVDAEAGVRRQEHAHMAFLTPTTISETPAGDVATVLKANIDPEAPRIGPVVLRHTKFGITVLADYRASLDNRCAAVQESRLVSAAMTIRVAGRRRPHARIVGVDPDVSPYDLVRVLNARNRGLDLEVGSTDVRFSFTKRSGNRTHVLLIAPDAFARLMARRRVAVGWTSAFVEEDLHVPMCTFCASYRHTHRNCRAWSDPARGCQAGDAEDCCAEGGEAL